MAWLVVAAIGVVGLYALVWGLRASLVRLMARAVAELAAAGERVVIPPAPAKFTGASWLRRPRGDGIIALTGGEVLFWPLFGPAIRIRREEIEGVRTARWFRGYRRAGREQLVLELSGGRKIGFIVVDPAGWTRVLKEGT